MRRFPSVFFVLMLGWSATAGWAQSALTWEATPGAGSATVGATLDLALSQPGAAEIASHPLPVAPNGPLALSCQYAAANLSTDVQLLLSVRWLDGQGRDVDEQRRQLGFPPTARWWALTKNAAQGQDFADNLTAPGNAAAAVVSLRLERTAAGREARVSWREVRLAPGETTPVGLEAPVTGPADAGPLSAPPAGVAFGTNLVANGALEEGTEGPSGWHILGDNANGSVLWQEGGAFSGRRSFKLYDRGPYVRSWGEAHPGLFVPGGAPDGGYPDAREEVSARWVSDPAPATPGQPYQASAFLWYGNRDYLDRGEANPVRIEFLDRRGQVLRFHDIWQDWLPSMDVITQAGWVPVWGRPAVAPADAVSVRLCVVLQHAFFAKDSGVVDERVNNRGFVMADNLALYAVKTSRPLWEADGYRPALSAADAYDDTVAAGAMPFVPTSPAHRPNTLRTESQGAYPGGIVFTAAAPAARKGSPLRQASLALSNLIGDPRDVTVSYDLLDWQGQKVCSGQGSAAVPSFGHAQIALDGPADLPLGPYTLQYVLSENGQRADQGETRLALMAPLAVTPAERGRLDYPFSLWAPGFSNVVGTPAEAEWGQLMQASGMGQSWFGCAGPIYMNELVTIKDPAARHAAVQARIDRARQSIAAWRKYGITPMGHLEPPQLMKPEDYPVLAEVVTQLVTGLEGDIHQWRWGTEHMHGGVKDLDTATQPDGSLYLYWGEQGTVRQYWAEYLVAQAAAKQADPTCRFGPNSASDIEGDVLRLFFQVADKSKLDMFGMNTYISAYAIWPPNENELKKNGVPDLPIFVSEFGVSGAKPMGPAHFADETAAATRLVTYWTQVLNSFPNLFHLEQWGMILGDDEGSLTYRHRVRPQYVAYKTMTENLGAGKFGAHYQPPGAEVYVRERTARPGPVAVMWATGPGALVELQTGSPTVTLCDLWGNQRQVATRAGVVAVQLTAQPQYLLGARRIAPAETLKITFAHADTDSTHPRIAVTVTNERPEPVAGTLTLAPESALALSPAAQEVATLAQGASRTFYFDVTPLPPVLDRRLPVRARLVAGDRTYEARGALNFHSATLAAHPPAIDGDLSDWPADFPLVVDRVDQFANEGSPLPWGGPGDCSGRMALQWDATNLYVAARVTDDVHSPSDKPGVEFTKDSIELLLDTGRGLSNSSPFEMFTLADFADGQARVRRYDGALPKGEVPGAQIAVRRVGTETRYEAAIPWKEINPAFRPTEGQTISLAFTIDDNDEGTSGRRGMSWFSLATTKNPAAFGDVTLVRPGAAPAAAPPANLLPNGNFESDTLPPGPQMQGWTLSAGSAGEQNAEASLTTAGAYQGRSLKIHRLSPKNNMEVGGWRVPVHGGEVYLFRCLARSDERQVIAWLRPLDAAGKSLPSLGDTQALSPAASWHYGCGLYLNAAEAPDRSQYSPLVGVFETPAGAAQVQVSFSYSWATGDAYVDNAELYRLR